MIHQQRYFIHLAFDGTRYSGWQRQPNAVTVQETIENQLSILLKKEISLIGCGRTDTGVHARDFYAHFDFEELNNLRLQKLLSSLNHTLPTDIVVYGITPVTSDAHARYSALWRTYRYYISTTKNPFVRPYRWFRFKPADLESMNKAATLLTTIEDFTSFVKLHSNNTNNLCKVREAYWEKSDTDLIFTITANRFLRNMVRAIVGTLWEIGCGKLNPEDILLLAKKKNRSATGASVPASGLFLEKIVYPDDIFIRS